MNNETQIALLELEHCYGKEVRDKVEYMGFMIQKHGHWIDDCTCSVCYWTNEDYEGFTLLTKYPFCPCCGTKMDEMTNDG